MKEIIKLLLDQVAEQEQYVSNLQHIADGLHAENETTLKTIAIVKKRIAELKAAASYLESA